MWLLYVTGRHHSVVSSCTLPGSGGGGHLEFFSVLYGDAQLFLVLFGLSLSIGENSELGENNIRRS